MDRRKMIMTWLQISDMTWGEHKVAQVVREGGGGGGGEEFCKLPPPPPPPIPLIELPLAPSQNSRQNT